MYTFCHKVTCHVEALMKNKKLFGVVVGFFFGGGYIFFLTPSHYVIWICRNLFLSWKRRHFFYIFIYWLIEGNRINRSINRLCSITCIITITISISCKFCIFHVTFSLVFQIFSGFFFLHMIHFICTLPGQQYLDFFPFRLVCACITHACVCIHVWCVCVYTCTCMCACVCVWVCSFKPLGLNLQFSW